VPERFDGRRLGKETVPADIEPKSFVSYSAREAARLGIFLEDDNRRAAPG
jgi:hypothetical protein